MTEPYGDEALMIWNAAIALLDKGDVEGARLKIKEGAKSDSLALERTIARREATVYAKGTKQT